MKKYLALFLTMVMGASVLAGCGGSDSAKTFTVGFDAEYPPYGYRTESGDYAGFDLDLAAEVCERNGWELVKQPIDWDAKDMELSSGAIDCIWNGFTMNGREDAYTWTEPYIDNSQVFVVASASGVQNKEELAGKVVAVQKDSSALAALNDEENADNIALRDSFEVAKTLGIPIECNKIWGVGAKSPLWKKIIANVLNIKVDVLETEEGPSLGGAMLAAVACGEYKDVESAAAAIVKVVDTVEPDPELAAKYEARYQQFKNIYPACKDLFDKII